MNSELLSLYEGDRQERLIQTSANTPEYRVLRANDLQRRERVLVLVAANELHTAEDYYHAAWIMNHGDTAEEARISHKLALRSTELGFRPARWLAAASYDRWQMYQGKVQKFGTNYLYDGRRIRLWNVDTKTTDEERAHWDVPPLAEQLRKAEEASRNNPPMSENERKEFEANAPEWFKEILKRWRAEESLSNQDSTGCP